jgi:DNA-binding MarR family transcriptional regulator
MADSLSMNVSSRLRAEADRFILEKIDSVPHLEALLLLWNSRPGKWPVGEIAKRLYIPEDRASRILQDLARQSLVFRSRNQRLLVRSFTRAERFARCREHDLSL